MHELDFCKLYLHAANKELTEKSDVKNCPCRALTGGMVLRICREGVKGVLALSRARSSGVSPLGSDPMLSGPMKLDAMAGDPSLAQRAACEPAPSCIPNSLEHGLP